MTSLIEQQRSLGEGVGPSSGWGRLLAAGWPSTTPLPQLDDEGGARDRLLAAAAGELAILPIPVEFGGTGGDLLHAASAQRAIGAVDPSIAVALNMHMLSVGLMTEHWQRKQDTSWMLLEAIATGHNLVGSAFAEPGGSANMLRSTTRAVRTPTGVRLNGVKFPCSLASTADLFCLSAQLNDEGTTIVALCPANSPGLAVTGSWRSLGMRSSDTARIELTDVEIDRRLVFHEAPIGAIDDVVIGGLVWFVALISATYHGVLSSLVEQAAAAPVRTTPHSRDAHLVAAVAELSAFGAACRSLATNWADGTVAGEQAMAAAAALRIRLSTTTDSVIATVRQLLGAAVYTQDAPASRLVLDALAAHHHPPSLPLCESLIAAAGAGRPLSLDLAT